MGKNNYFIMGNNSKGNRGMRLKLWEMTQSLHPKNAMLGLDSNQIDSKYNTNMSSKNLIFSN